MLNTHAVPRLFALNGESLENLPELKPGELRPTDVQEFATAVKDLAAGGFSFTGDSDAEAEVRRRIGFKPQSPEEAQARADEAAAQEAAQEAARAAAAQVPPNGTQPAPMPGEA